MARTIIFHENGDLILDVPEQLPTYHWNTDAYVYIEIPVLAGRFNGSGWYIRRFSAGRAGKPPYESLKENEVPAIIRTKLLLIK